MYGSSFKDKEHEGSRKRLEVIDDCLNEDMQTGEDIVEDTHEEVIFNISLRE